MAREPDHKKGCFLAIIKFLSASGAIGGLGCFMKYIYSKIPEENNSFCFLMLSVIICLIILCRTFIHIYDKYDKRQSNKNFYDYDNRKRELKLKQKCCNEEDSSPPDDKPSAIQKNNNPKESSKATKDENILEETLNNLIELCDYLKK